MDLIFWIMFGAIIGWISSILSNTSHTTYGKKSIIIGIVAAFVGGWVVHVLSEDQFQTLNIYAIIGATLSAILALRFRDARR